MNTCDAIQERLAEEGAHWVQDDADARRHLEGCADCTEILASLSELDQALDQLPQLDAPDALVDATLAAVRRAPRGSQMSNWATGHRRVISGALAASVIFAAGLGVMQTSGVLGPAQIASDAQPKYSRPYRAYHSGKLEMLQSGGGSSNTIAPANQETSDDLQGTTETAQVAQQKLDTPENRPQEPEEQEALFAYGQTFADGPVARETDEYYRKESRIIAQLESRLSHGERDGELDEISGDKVAEKKKPEGVVRGRLTEQPLLGSKSEVTGHYEETEGSEPLRLEDLAMTSNERPAPQDPPASQFRADDEVGAILGGDHEGASRENLSDDKNRALGEQGSEKPNKDLVRGLSKLDPDQAGVAGEAVATPEAEPVASGAPSVVDEDGRHRRSGRLGAERLGVEQPRGLAKDFLAQLQAVDGLTFQSATGYWSNTYLPGDAAMRLLQARLQDWNRAQLGQEVRLEQAVRPVAQPFDGPEDAALALYLHGDTQAIQGPTRLRLQVGIKGAERQGGRRPAMNVGLVVDLRDTLDQATNGRLRALILSLERARQPGDRFSLTVAGPGGGMLVVPERFKHGPLRVAMDRLFDPAKGAETPALDLLEAVTLATRSVRAGDDPSSVLGASLVLLATGAPIARDMAALEEIAHVNAVSGVPMSVVSLGGGTDLDHVDRLVAAGQGNRRILAAADEAEALIDRELHSASRAVARALRLRIRLAPGVQLVQVLGSRHLGDPQSQLVREAEQALDRRLARNLGIQADRGEDEEGIQIVIPSFYAGDSHVVLLDLVATRP
jgi:hypothetical protein